MSFIRSPLVAFALMAVSGLVLAAPTDSATQTPDLPLVDGMLSRRSVNYDYASSDVVKRDGRKHHPTRHSDCLFSERKRNEVCEDHCYEHDGHHYDEDCLLTLVLSIESEKRIGCKSSGCGYNDDCLLDLVFKLDIDLSIESKEDRKPEHGCKDNKCEEWKMKGDCKDNNCEEWKKNDGCKDEDCEEWRPEHGCKGKECEEWKMKDGCKDKRCEEWKHRNPTCKDDCKLLGLLDRRGEEGGWSAWSQGPKNHKYDNDCLLILSLDLDLDIKETCSKKRRDGCDKCHGHDNKCLIDLVLSLDLDLELGDISHLGHLLSRSQRHPKCRRDCSLEHFGSDSRRGGWSQDKHGNKFDDDCLFSLMFSLEVDYKEKCRRQGGWNQQCLLDVVLELDLDLDLTL